MPFRLFQHARAYEVVAPCVWQGLAHLTGFCSGSPVLNFEGSTAFADIIRDICSGRRQAWGIIVTLRAHFRAQKTSDQVTSKVFRLLLCLAAFDSDNGYSYPVIFLICCECKSCIPVFSLPLRNPKFLFWCVLSFRN